jgi:hypothetical protein
MRLRISIFSLAAVVSALAQEGRVIRCDTPPPTPQQVAQDRFRVRPFDFFYDKMVRTTWTTVSIPVVIHVLLDDDGKGDVTVAVLTEQVKVLSDSFRKHGFTFFIEKITRTKNSKWYRMGRINNDDDSDAREAKEQLVADPARNLNLYIALPKPTGRLLGWARFPWQLAGNPKLDGVVILNSTLPRGSKHGYNQGKTAVHEVGHWLGLYHTFEGGCTADGDEVGDTPAQDAPSEGDCDSQKAKDSCPDSPGLDDYQNFMDYTHDACLVHFTRGQAKRMQLQVVTYRAALVPPETGEALRVVASSIDALRKVDLAADKLFLEAKSQKAKR